MKGETVIKKIRRVVCLILAFYFVSIAPIQVSAVTTTTSEQSLALVVTQLSNQYPNSIVNVVDGVVHIYISETDTFENAISLSGEISTMATVTSIYAPDGVFGVTLKGRGTHAYKQAPRSQHK